MILIFHMYRKEEKDKTKYHVKQKTTHGFRKSLLSSKQKIHFGFVIIKMSEKEKAIRILS